MGTTETVMVIHRGEKHSEMRRSLEPLVDTDPIVRSSQYDDVVEMLVLDGELCL